MASFLVVRLLRLVLFAPDDWDTWRSLHPEMRAMGEAIAANLVAVALNAATMAGLATVSGLVMRSIAG
jgi:hypothetical protein